jgi:GTPase Era involved in 16S rRNA processing
MKNKRDRIERLERLLIEYLKRNPPKVDVNDLSEEERRAIINLSEMVQEYVNTRPKEESPEIYAAILEMIRENRRSCN